MLDSSLLPASNIGQSESSLKKLMDMIGYFKNTAVYCRIFLRMLLLKYFDPLFDNRIFFFAFLRKIQLDNPPKTHLKNVESVVSFVENQPEHIEKNGVNS